MNRFLRRLRRFSKGPGGRRSPDQRAEQGRETFRAGASQDVPTARAKSSRHGKVTADKWNQ
jgi:hypothetical protein